MAGGGETGVGRPFRLVTRPFRGGEEGGALPTDLPLRLSSATVDLYTFYISREGARGTNTHTPISRPVPHSAPRPVTVISSPLIGRGAAQAETLPPPPTRGTSTPLTGGAGRWFASSGRELRDVTA